MVVFVAGLCLLAGLILLKNAGVCWMLFAGWFLAVLNQGVSTYLLVACCQGHHASREVRQLHRDIKSLHRDLKSLHSQRDRSISYSIDK